MRNDDRMVSELRVVKIETGYIKYPEGSVLISMGETKVICNATIEERVPPHKMGSGSGWITAEYSMLPRATQTRVQRDINKLKQNPRSVEIQRLIGRSLRAVADLDLLGERSITIDCDVIQADGGTRTASITGAFVALSLACEKLIEKGLIDKWPLKGQVAAVSVGLVDGEAILDLNYQEDSKADVDMNVVMTNGGRFIEIQGTGEEATFSKQELQDLLTLAENGITKLFEYQKKAIEA